MTRFFAARIDHSRRGRGRVSSTAGTMLSQCGLCLAATDQPSMIQGNTSTSLGLDGRRASQPSLIPGCTPISCDTSIQFNKKLSRQGTYQSQSDRKCAIFSERHQRTYTRRSNFRHCLKSRELGQSEDWVTNRSFRQQKSLGFLQSEISICEPVLAVHQALDF